MSAPNGFHPFRRWPARFLVAGSVKEGLVQNGIGDLEYHIPGSFTEARKLQLTFPRSVISILLP